MNLPGFIPAGARTLPDCHAELPRADLFRRPDGFGPGCMSIEEAGFVYALVRMVKPVLALETGCEGGLTTCAIAAALEDNNCGQLVTVEMEARWRAHTAAMLDGLRLNDRVSLLAGDSRDHIRTLPPETRLGFALLDSSIPTRLDELDLLMTRGHLAPDGWVVIHDTRPEHPMRGSAPLVADYIASRPWAANIRQLDFPSPRGLTVLSV